MKKRAIYTATALMLGGFIPLNNKNTQSNNISYEIYAAGFLNSDLIMLNSIKEEVMLINNSANAYSFETYNYYISSNLDIYKNIENITIVEFRDNILTLKISSHTGYCLKGNIYKDNSISVTKDWFFKDIFK